ncbi:MAG: FeoA family protein [Candidatus Heteroscillospira sp.]|jgi:Fe2+ transport system protein FeoA
MNTTLWNLELGSSGEISRLRGDTAARRRLMDLGFVPGARPRKLLENRGMAAWLIGGTLIALRREDADRILMG